MGMNNKMFLIAELPIWPRPSIKKPRIHINNAEKRILLYVLTKHQPLHKDNNTIRNFTCECKISE